MPEPIRVAMHESIDRRKSGYTPTQGIAPLIDLLNADRKAFLTSGTSGWLALAIWGNVFSRHDTHFRLSYAANDATLDRGIAALREMC